jgi:hypothetical protein
VVVLRNKYEFFGTVCICLGVPLISFVKNEGMIFMFFGQVGWIIFSFKEKYWFFFFQSIFLELFNVIGLYNWIVLGRGTWLL